MADKSDTKPKELKDEDLGKVSGGAGAGSGDGFNKSGPKK